MPSVTYTTGGTGSSTIATSTSYVNTNNPWTWGNTTYNAPQEEKRYHVGEQYHILSTTTNIDDIQDYEDYKTRIGLYQISRIEYDSQGRQTITRLREVRNGDPGSEFSVSVRPIIDYYLYTVEEIKAKYKDSNTPYAAICKKVNELYRKHNASGSSFKFQGV